MLALALTLALALAMAMALTLALTLALALALTLTLAGITAILANGSCDSFARIVVFGSKLQYPMVFLNSRKQIRCFFCEKQ